MTVVYDEAFAKLTRRAALIDCYIGFTPKGEDRDTPSSPLARVLFNAPPVAVPQAAVSR